MNLSEQDKAWFNWFLNSLPVNNRSLLKENADKREGIFNPSLYSQREMT